MVRYYRNGIDQIREPCILLDNGEIITMECFIEWLIANVHPTIDIWDSRTRKDDQGRWRRFDE